MKNLILLLTLLASFQAFGATGIPSGSGSVALGLQTFDFNGHVYPKENDTASITYKAIQFSANANSQDTIYQVPAGKQFRVIGFAFTTDAAGYFNAGYQDNSQTGAGRFTGTSQKTLDGSTSANDQTAIWYQSAAGFSSVDGMESIIPASKYVVVVGYTSATFYGTMYGYEEAL